jgi:hypothetical protein
MDVKKNLLVFYHSVVTVGFYATDHGENGTTKTAGESCFHSTVRFYAKPIAMKFM